MSKNQFQNLMSWSQDQYSELPWRQKRTLYKTLVSEIMLQQTTVGTVLNHFERFLAEYPTIFDLAKSTEDQVCVSWKGLGYYRRARNLRNLAIQIVDQYNGKVPTTLDELLGLKGIGPYTANAIRGIGADQVALAVDANLERVLSRFYGVEVGKGPMLQKALWSMFDEGSILPEMKKLSPRGLNEAFMDLGRIICQAKKASCLICPLNKNCKAYLNGNPLALPREGVKKTKVEHSLKLIRFIVKEKNKILFYQKEKNEWLAGQWELPTFILESSDKKMEQYPSLKYTKKLNEEQKIKTSITKYAIENYYVEISAVDFKKLASKVKRDYQFLSHTKDLNLSTASIKVLSKLK